MFNIYIKYMRVCVCAFVVDDWSACVGTCSDAILSHTSAKFTYFRAARPYTPIKVNYLKKKRNPERINKKKKKPQKGVWRGAFLHRIRPLYLLLGFFFFFFPAAAPHLNMLLLLLL